MNLKDYYLMGISYSEYMSGFKTAVAENRTSGPVQSTEFLHYTSLNLKRSERIFKHTALLPELKTAVQHLSKNLQALCITEYWCGDSAQVAPVLALLDEGCESVSIRYLFRDEHPSLIDRYLTRGGRSIPKYIFFDARSGKELFTYGPRPEKAYELLENLKSEEKDTSEITEALHRWYAADKTQNIQLELISLFNTIPISK